MQLQPSSACLHSCSSPLCCLNGVTDAVDADAQITGWSQTSSLVQVPALAYHDGASIASDDALPETPYGNTATTGTIPAGFSRGQLPVSNGKGLSNGHTG